MKKFKLFMLAFVTVFSTMPAFAQKELSPNAEDFRKNVFSYLENEGYKPYIDEDDDLCFKAEGTLFWMSFDNGDEQRPVYVEFHRSGLKLEGADRENMILTANFINLKKKCVKASVGSKTLSFSIEMVYYDAAEFTRTIPRCMEFLNISYAAAMEFYNEL